MLLGGFQKNTLIDFPGEVASLLFTQGCNFHCPYCHNPDLVPMKSAGGEWISGDPSGDAASFHEDDVLSFLQKRKGLIDGVAITGGEPTLQAGLQTFCFRVKNMGFKVKLDTNGSCPKVLKALFDRELVDYVAMDVKSTLEGYSSLAGFSFDPSCLTESISLIIKGAPKHEFRTTCVKPFVNLDTMGEMLNLIAGTSHYVLQRFSPRAHLLNASFFQGMDPACSDEEMREFQTMAHQRGIECVIR